MQKCGIIEKSLAVQEDPTCGRAVKPAATTAEALEPHAPQQEKPPPGEPCTINSNPHSWQLGKA